MEFHAFDVLDLKPDWDSRGQGYNIISAILGGWYHGIFGGNQNLQTRAEWTETAGQDMPRN